MITKVSPFSLSFSSSERLQGGASQAGRDAVLGAVFWYYVGKLVGAERLKGCARRHGRWLTMRPEDVDEVDSWFDRHCAKAVLIGRLVPAIRTLTSIPAGIFGMSFPRFLLFSTIGTVVRNTLFTAAGYAVESRFDAVADYPNPLMSAIVAAIVAYYLYRLATWKPG